MKQFDDRRRQRGVEDQRHGRRLLALGAVLFAAIVATIIVIALRGPARFEPGTPEHVAQQYLTAVIDGDPELAATYIDESVDCDEHGLSLWRGANLTLVDSRVGDSSATLTIRIRTVEVDLLEVIDTYDPEFQMVLVRSGDDWFVTEPGWPLGYCRKVN